MEQDVTSAEKNVKDIVHTLFEQIHYTKGFVKQSSYSRAKTVKDSQS